MSDLLHIYTEMSGSYPNTFFAGANTADGFVSAYPVFIQERQLDRVFVIKGGSGTGKSSLMKACAAAASNLGASVTLLLCSSDPSSADAVRIQGKNGKCIALLDGTAPHIVDPEIPGAVGEIVNVGRFWDADMLEHQREEIFCRIKEKKKAYERAYRFLSAYRHITSLLRNLLSDCILYPKMEAAVDRLLAPVQDGKRPHEEIRPTYALSMTGAFHLNTFSTMACKQYLILDRYGCGEFLLQEIRRAALQKGCTVWGSPAPACPDLLNELYLPASKTVFRIVPDAQKIDASTGILNMQRFIDRNTLSHHRSKIRFADKCRGAILNGALQALSDAQTEHFALEDIYKSAMDFQGVRAEGERISREIEKIMHI